MRRSLLHRGRSRAGAPFECWYAWKICSCLKPVKRAARMLRKHPYELLAYFRHWISNAAVEGPNSKIQAIKLAARGFRNFDNY